MSSNGQGDRLCAVVVQNQKMTNATARIAAWLIGAASATGGFPLKLSLREVNEGFSKNGVFVEGTGSRIATIKTAFEWLENEGYLKSEDGSASGFGHFYKMYRLDI